MVRDRVGECGLAVLSEPSQFQSILQAYIHGDFSPYLTPPQWCPVRVGLGCVAEKVPIAEVGGAEHLQLLRAIPRRPADDFIHLILRPALTGGLPQQKPVDLTEIHLKYFAVVHTLHTPDSDNVFLH